MLQALFCIYSVNAIFLILHEIESAYWKEWELFKMKGGITGFIILHIPILALIFLGLVTLYVPSRTGMVVSILLCAGGIFAFSIHTYFIKKGKEEFTLPISKILLYVILVLSVAQLVITILAIIKFDPLYVIL
ncbi:MAG: hypothetical protein GPJ51_13110 [Candidatus Heimdallarchaeota archaeon]|nr:hypothetical protein [Candidatus Heimdallarchaeota archaeon]